METESLADDATTGRHVAPAFNMGRRLGSGAATFGSMSFDRALSNRRRVPRRTGKPVFGSLRSAVWNTATFASRVFDGLPSSPFPWSCGWGEEGIGDPV